MWTAPRDTQSNDIEEKEVKHKAPDEARRPAKEEMFETDALRLEGRTVQAGNETKPLECDICGKRFLNNLALAGHMQNPDAIYDCHICRQEFGQVPSLTEHVYMHNKGGNFTCPHCLKTFTRNP